MADFQLLLSIERCFSQWHSLNKFRLCSLLNENVRISYNTWLFYPDFLSIIYRFALYPHNINACFQTTGIDRFT